jgi:hypothetical protein
MLALSLNIENNLDNKESETIFSDNINIEDQKVMNPPEHSSNNFFSLNLPSNNNFQYRSESTIPLENNVELQSTPEIITDFNSKNVGKLNLKEFNAGNIWDGGITPVVQIDGWTQINFSASFSVPPTVLVTIIDTTDNVEDIKAGYHIRSKNTLGFEVYAKKYGNISWVAYGQGSGGYSNYEHGKVDVLADEWVEVSFSSNWSSIGGVVISQETSIEDLRSASIKQVNNNNFQVLSKYSLKIHWIAVGEGTGGSDDPIVHGIKENFPKEVWETINYSGQFSILPTVVKSQENLGSVGDVRDNPIDLLTRSNFTSFAKTAINDMNWIAIGGDTEAPIFHDYGLENSGTGFARFWVNASDTLSGVASVTLNYNGSQVDMNINGSGYWIYDPVINYNEYISYQIVNTTDNAGNSLFNPTVQENITFNYDIVTPIINNFDYAPNSLTNGTFFADISDSWGTIDTVRVNLPSCNCEGPTSSLMTYNGTHYLADSLQIKRGSFSYEIFVNDTAGNSVTSPVHPDYLSNNAPIIDNLTLSPDPIRSNQELSISYDFSDIDGDSEGGTEIRWYKNDSLVINYNDSLIIHSFELVEGDRWYATVKPKDGQNFGYIKNSSTIIIGNAVPEANDVRISPATVYSTTELLANYLFSDADGDAENITNRKIFWFRNGLIVPNLNNSLSVANIWTNKSEIWSFSLQVSDSSELSTTYYSSNITIVNSKPIVFDPTFNATTVGDTSDFNITYQYSDVDNDLENVSFRKIYWFVNGFYNSSYDNQTVIYASNTSEGEFWYYLIQVFDGFEYSNNFTSTGISIGAPLNLNAPTVSNLTLINPNPNSADALIIVYNYTDIENNPEAGTEIWWYKNVSGIWEIQHDYNGTRILPFNDTRRGEQWLYSVKPKDGLLFGTIVNSSVFTIMNTKPVLSSSELIPTIAYTTTSLNVNYQFFDIDSDSIIGLYVKWYNNSIEVPILENNTFLDSFYTLKGQTWFYNISIFDGLDWSDWVVSSNVTIQNTLPTTDNLILVGGAGTNIGITLFYDFIDPDNDVNSSTIIWFVNSAEVVGENTIFLPSSYFISGDRIHAEIIPSDGFENGTLVTSEVFPNGVIIVENTVPEITGTPIIFDINNENVSFFTNSTLFIRYNASDLDGILDGNNLYDIELDGDGLVFAAKYRWYKNGVLQTSLTSPFVPSEFLFKGDIWIASVSPRDRFGGFGIWVNSTSVIITNVRPEIRNFRWIIPEPTAQDDLIFDYDFIDLDFDSEQTEELITHWYYLNGTEISIGQNQTILPSVVFKKGDFIYVEFQVFDTEDYSDVFSSPIIKIQNSLPVGTLVTISPNFPLSGDNLSLVYNYYDYDNDVENKSNLSVRWFKNGQLVPNYVNKTEISSFDTQPGEIWIVQIQVFDGYNYSFMNQSISIVIVGTTLEFMNTQYDDFILDTEDISISFSFTEPFLNSIKHYSHIFWYVNNQYQPSFDNRLSISSTLTTPGEVWRFIVVPFNGENFGAELLSESRTIESLPDFNEYGVENRSDNEGHYVIWANVTDTRHNIYSVTLTIILNNSETQSFPLTYNGTVWLLNYQLENYSLLNTLTTIEMEATTRIVNYTSPELVTVQNSFDFNLTDKAPPRIKNVVIEYDDIQNPREITFHVTIEEKGLGIENIKLYYYFKPVDNSSTSGVSYKTVQGIADLEKFQSVDLFVIEESLYSISLDFIHENQNIQILYFIDIEDKAGNRDPFAYSEIGLNPNRPDGTWIFIPAGLPFEIIIIAILIISLILGLFSFIVIKKFRKTELVGLDIDKIMEELKNITNLDIDQDMNFHTLGIVISTFHQKNGPTPLFVLPDLLTENLDKLIDLSDRSFSTTRFVDNFETERQTIFEYPISATLELCSLTFGFSLNRPTLRGGAENLTLNILIYQPFEKIISQFLEKISPLVHEIHLIMDKTPEEKDIIDAKVQSLRKQISAIILAYKNLYGEKLPEEHEDQDF